MPTFFRAVVVSVAFSLILSMLWYLQTRFDNADLKKAAQVLYEAKPFGGEKTLVDAMARELELTSETELECLSELESRFQGYVLIDCKTKEGDQRFLWRIDVIQALVVPANDRAKKVLDGLKEAS